MSELNLEHSLPKKEYVKIYWHNGYELLTKTFSNLEMAVPFIDKLRNSNGQFYYLKARLVKEKDIPF